MLKNLHYLFVIVKSGEKVQLVTDNKPTTLLLLYFILVKLHMNIMDVDNEIFCRLFNPWYKTEINTIQSIHRCEAS